MLPLLRLFWLLCQLRAGPQDVPASPALLRLVMLASLISGILAHVTMTSLPDGVLRTAVSLALSLLFWSVTLQALGRQSRQLQTLTAVFGCAALMNLLLFLLLLVLPAPKEGSALAASLVLLLASWSLLINGNILRHALEWSLAAAIALALLLFFLRTSLLQIIFS